MESSVAAMWKMERKDTRLESDNVVKKKDYGVWDECFGRKAM